MTEGGVAAVESDELVVGSSEVRGSKIVSAISSDRSTARRWSQKMQSPYAGMTTNERIVVGGRLAEWDSAVYASDRLKMIGILTDLDLGSQAESIVDQILSNLELYGYHLKQ